MAVTRPALSAAPPGLTGGQQILAAVAGLILGLGLEVGPLVFTLLAFEPDAGDVLPVLWVAVATIVGLGGGWLLCALVLRRAGIERAAAATWWAWGISLAASVVLNIVVGAVTFVVGLMSVALIWSGDWLGAIAGVALLVSGTIAIVIAVLVTMAAARRTQPGAAASTPYG